MKKQDGRINNHRPSMGLKRFTFEVAFENYKDFEVIKAMKPQKRGEILLKRDFKKNKKS